jgi:pilus assembly protein CpaC
MTNTRFMIGTAAGFALVSLALASNVDAKTHPKPKHTTMRAKPSVTVHTIAYGSNSAMRPSGDVSLATGHGELINLSEPVSDVFTSNPQAVDINVRSTTQVYIFGKGRGESSVYATNKSGRIIYSSNVRVEQYLDSLDQMLRVAMPEAQITATKISGMIILTGTVLSPEDATQAELLVNGYVGNEVGSKTKKVLVLNHIKTATPQQVNLQVRIAEVSRSVSKNIGVNLTTAGKDGGTVFGVSSGRNVGSIASKSLAGYPTRDFSTQFGYPAGTLASLPYDPVNPGVPLNPVNPGKAFNLTNLAQGAGTTALGIGGHFLGMDVLSALDLAETDGLAKTLAQPNLTALSGETASFLAGGEIPITVATPSTTGTTLSVEYKSYGISLSFTPVVLADGRVSMRVRPEVSELDYANAITLSGFSIPALTVRRSETTVEMGSGQSMVISGLLKNRDLSTTTKAPGVGDVPVLGALFRSNQYQRGETELMIVVTPYLVKPVNANQIVLPTDGVKTATDLQRVLLGKNGDGTTGGDRPKPTMAPAKTSVTPSVGALEALPATPKPVAPEQNTPAPAQVGLVQPVAAPQPASPARAAKHGNTDASPGFGS